MLITVSNHGDEGYGSLQEALGSIPREHKPEVQKTAEGRS